MTPQQAAQFTTLWNEGATRAEIADAMGCARSTVGERRIKLGLPGRNEARSIRPIDWTDAELEVVRRGWEGGRTGSQIAAGLPGRSRSAVVAKANREGWRQPEKHAARPRAPQRPAALPRPVAPPRPEPIDPSAPVASSPRPFLSRKMGHECAWVTKEDGHDMACCNPVVGGGSWCSGHRRLVFVDRSTLSPSARRGYSGARLASAATFYGRHDNVVPVGEKWG